MPSVKGGSVVRLRRRRTHASPIEDGPTPGTRASYEGFLSGVPSAGFGFSCICARTGGAGGV